MGTFSETATGFLVWASVSSFYAYMQKSNSNSKNDVDDSNEGIKVYKMRASLDNKEKDGGEEGCSDIGASSSSDSKGYTPISPASSRPHVVFLNSFQNEKYWLRRMKLVSLEGYNCDSLQLSGHSFLQRLQLMKTYLNELRDTAPDDPPSVILVAHSVGSALAQVSY